MQTQKVKTVSNFLAEVDMPKNSEPVITITIYERSKTA